MRRVDAVLLALAFAGIASLAAAAILYDPPPRHDPVPTPTTTAPVPTPTCMVCLTPLPVQLDAADGHTVWSWNGSVVVSSLAVDQGDAVLGIGWTHDEELVLRAAAFDGSTTHLGPTMRSFLPVPASAGRAYVTQESGVTSWTWRSGATSALAGLDNAVDAQGGRVLGWCASAWCIHDGSIQQLSSPGEPGRAGGLGPDGGYVTVRDNGTRLYRAAALAEPELVAEADIARVAVGHGVAWELAGGGVVVAGDDYSELPNAARPVWAGEQLVYVVHEPSRETVVMLHPDIELARFAPREDVQALAADAQAVWVAGTVLVDGGQADVLIRIPLT